MIMIAISVQRVVLNAGAKIRRLWSKFRCSSSYGADDDNTGTYAIRANFTRSR